MANHLILKHGANYFMKQPSSTAPVIKNGSGGSSPARNEIDSAHVLENLFNADRYSMWASLTGAGSPSSITIDVDLGLNSDSSMRTVSHFGLLGFRKRGFFPTSGGFYTVGDDTSGYTPASPALVQSFSMTFVNGERDMVVALASPILARYVRFLWSSVSTSGLMCGKLAAWGVQTADDIGPGSPGMEVTEKMGRLRSRLYSGAPVVATVGDPSTYARVPFDAINSTALARLTLLNREDKPFTWIDDNGRAREMVLAGDGVTYTKRWNNLYDAVLEMESLG